jgi:hypothetical protein
MHVRRRKLVLCISYKMKYLQNEARKQKSVKEVTLQFSMIFQFRLKNNTVNFRVICLLNRPTLNHVAFLNPRSPNSMLSLCHDELPQKLYRRCLQH